MEYDRPRRLRTTPVLHAPPPPRRALVPWHAGEGGVAVNTGTVNLMLVDQAEKGYRYLYGWGIGLFCGQESAPMALVSWARGTAGERSICIPGGGAQPIGGLPGTSSGMQGWCSGRGVAFTSNVFSG